MKKWCLYVTAASLPFYAAQAHAREPRPNAEPAILTNTSSSQIDTVSTDDADALLETSLEDLLVLESTSVAKKRQNVADSAAAVYVITQEDIRNSASNTIPDLLRVVPGVEVGEILNGGTAVSIRGFNGRNSNSLLVMVDGRSIYVSTLSGVFWDQLQIPLADIERIEVVRGPGATLWGANAVNGVINIITKNSADTLGVQASARIGNRSQEAVLSYGSRLGEDATVRIHGSYRRDQGLQSAEGDDFSTTQESIDTGIRVDWSPSEKDNLTFQAGYQHGDFESQTISIDPALINPNPIPVITPVIYDEIYGLARWTRAASDELDLTLQTYATYIVREELGFFSFDYTILDLDIGANWRPNDTHDISLGVGARGTWDNIDTTGISASFINRSNEDLWISAYLQDDISLIADTLRLTLGAKFEKNNFTGVEFQPGARIFYRPSENVALWGAVSRAVRTPSRFERDADLKFSVIPPSTDINPGPIPIFPRLIGFEDIESERLTSIEAGFRANLSDAWHLDVAAYYNQYSRLNEPTQVGLDFNIPPGFPFPVSITQTAQFQSRGEADTWGFEAVLKGEVTPEWQTQISYSNFNADTATDPLTGAPFLGFLSLEGSPEHQAAFLNTWQVGSSVTVNSELRYVDSLLDGAVPSYVDADLRIRYDAPNGLELSLVGENLLDERRLEFQQIFYPAPASFNPRRLSAELRYRF